MAFTLHWSNHAYGCPMTGGNRTVPEKSVSLEPALSLQKDVILPRIAGHFGGETAADDDANEDRLYGCRGHGLDQEFPLKPTSDMSMPLVLCRGPPVVTRDVCAEPVLNWEQYVLKLKKHSQPKFPKRVLVDADEVLRGATSVEPKKTPNRQRKSVKSAKVDTFGTEFEIPEDRVEGTWNFNYTNPGTCDILRESSGVHKVLVGNGEALRVVTLEESQENSTCRFEVKEVKDEGNIASRGVIRQIQCIESENLAFVRRPSKISIYAIDEGPAELDAFRPSGYRLEKRTFLTFHCNPHNCNELVAVDSDHEVRLHNFVKGESEFLFAMKTEKSDSIWNDGPPDFTINVSSSIRYLNHPSLMLVQHGRKIWLYDRRANLLEDLKVENPRKLFNIKEDTISFSDCFRGSYDGSTMRPEYISSVAPSNNSNYYHIGTSHRILTMDWRVPGNPALRCSHGMNSPLSYLKSTMIDDHEVLVGGSQRTNETFAVVLDHGHRVCQGRSGCEAVNPILASYPRHLLSTSESSDKGANFLPWSDERKLLQNRYEAWCSGLATTALCRNGFGAGASVSIFTTNTFGDVFYQEWKHIEETQVSADSQEDTNLPVLKRALENSLSTAFKRHSDCANDDESLGPSDFSLVVDEASASVATILDIRSKSFSAFERSKDVEPCRSIDRVLSDINFHGGPLVEKLYRAWEENPEDLEEGVSDTEGRDPSDMNASTYEESTRSLTQEELEIPVDVEIKEEPEDYPDSEIEVLQPEPKAEVSAEELVLSDSEFTFYGIPGLTSLTKEVLNGTAGAGGSDDENMFDHAGPSSSTNPSTRFSMPSQTNVDQRRTLGSQSFSSQPAKRRTGFK